MLLSILRIKQTTNNNNFDPEPIKIRTRQITLNKLFIANRQTRSGLFHFKQNKKTKS